MASPYRVDAGSFELFADFCRDAHRPDVVGVDEADDVVDISARPGNEHWSVNRAGRSVDFTIAASVPGGFEVGATCELWGILPRAGLWEDCPWEPYEWSVEEMCAAYFGLVRALLSADGRLRLEYDAGALKSVAIELLRPDGWFVFDEIMFKRRPHSLLPHEVILQNSHLPSRHPFGGLIPTVMGTYPWSKGC
jgi:hypothetical protein